jgi:hypothetical protein
LIMQHIQRWRLEKNALGLLRCESATALKNACYRGFGGVVVFPIGATRVTLFSGSLFFRINYK